MSTLLTGIEVENLSYTYPRSRDASLSNVNFKLHVGQCTGLIGPNGAGKSTLLSVLSGLLTAEQAIIKFPNANNMSFNQYVQRHVALVPQEYAFYAQLTVTQNLDYFASLCCKTREQRRTQIASVLHQCDLLEEQNQQAKWLSGGYKRRLNLAIALLKNPTILYLDEPTVGVDPVSRETILKLIGTLKEQGKTLIFTSHMLSEVQAICDEIIMLNQGRAFKFESTETRKILEIELEDPLALPLQTQLNDISRCQFAGAKSVQCSIETLQQIFDILQVINNSKHTIRSIHFGPESLTQQYIALLRNNDPSKR